jgi:hypothetical protein
MALVDIPVYREARRGQVVRSDDWNGIQREARQSIRNHRHTRRAGDPPNDPSPVDAALQITTPEIADGAVTSDKLSDDVREGLGGAGGGGGAARTDVIRVEANGRARVEHGFGNVPVAVTLGIRQRVQQLEGTFEVYGGPIDRTLAFAAVPTEPDGTFVVVSTANVDQEIRWWAQTQVNA